MAGAYNRKILYFNGLGCCASGGLSGLGFVDPATAALMLSQAKTTLSNAIAQIENFLGIGAGRREADLIVPTQKLITAQVLAPISAAVQPGEIEQSTCNELHVLLTTLNQAETKWLEFLHDSRWIDGRASAQAESTLAPYFTGLRADLTDEIQVKCAGGIIGIPGGTSNNTLLYAGLGLAVILLPQLMKRR